MFSKTSDKSYLIIALLLGILVNLVLYQFYGIKVVNDTSQYWYYGDLIRKGLIYREHYFWYISYVLFLSVLKLFSTAPALVVFVQVLIYLTALLAIYDASLKIFNDSRAAFFSCLFYIFFIEIPTWNFYLLPESLYGSFLCLSIAAIVRYNGKIMNVLGCLLIAGFTFLIKPTGIVILTIFLMRVVHYHTQQIAFTKKTKTTIWTLLILITLIAGNKMVDSFNLVETYSRGDIIYDSPTMPTHPDKDLLMLTPPEDLVVPSKDYPPVIRVAFFMISNPVFSIKLMSTKALYLVLHIKPYYSAGHNLFIVLVLFPMYYFAARTYMKESVPSYIKKGFLIYVCFHILIIMLTVEDWDGRFIIPLMAPVALFGGMGILSVLKSSGVNHWLHQKKLFH